MMLSNCIRKSHKKCGSAVFILLLIVYSFTLEAANFISSSQVERELEAEVFLSRIKSQPDIFSWYDKDTVRIDDMLFSVPETDNVRVAFTGTEWTNGVIYYEFDDNVSQTNRDIWIDAAQYWVEVADIEFVPRTNQSNYVHIWNALQNLSHIGMLEGEQVMYIYNWNYPFIIAHEIGHTLGLRHEQTRPDRDLYITVNSDNIETDAVSNFLINPGAQTYLIPYDFESVMHYGECAFSIFDNCPSTGSVDGGRTITVLPPNEDQQAVIGSRDGLSASDKTGMAFRYGGRPDLISHSPNIDDFDHKLVEGQLVDARVVIKNQGTRSSFATTVHYYRSTNSTISSGDTLLATVNVPPLDIGEQFIEVVSLLTPFVTGDYWVGGCVAAVAREVIVANNCSEGLAFSVVSATSSDLIVRDPFAWDTTLAPGQLFRMQVTVDNDGVGGADSTVLRFYRSDNPTISIFDTQLGSFAVNAVSPGEAFVVQENLTTPNSTGSFWMGACIDSVDGETISDNNCSSGVPVTVAVAPDLVVESPGVSKIDLILNESITISAIVRNRGSASSEFTRLNYYRSIDDIISTSDASLGSSSVIALSVGATSPESAGRTISSTPGVYWIGSCVAAVSGESDIDNNCSTGVEVTVAAAPDLVVQSMILSESILFPGQTFTTRPVVKNQGTGTSDYTNLEYYQSTNDIISIFDTLIDTDDITSLSPGSTHSLLGSVTAPNSAGTYWIGTCVDPVSGETPVDNNCSTALVITVVDDHCVGGDVVIDDYDFNMDEYCSGTDSITVVLPSGSRGGVFLSPGISVSLEAPVIYLNPPFSVSTGASLCIGRSGACVSNEGL